jgi:hypothetical protein
MGRPSKYAPEVKERAIRRVREHRPEYPSQWAAITSIAAKLGCTTETLRRWVQQAERDAGERPGLTRRRSSTAGRSSGGVCGRSPRGAWGRADCRQLAIAPSTYYRHKHQPSTPTARSARAQRDDVSAVWSSDM